MYAITNPATGRTEQEFEFASREALDFAVETLHNGYRATSHARPEDRAGALVAAAELFRRRKAEFSALMTREMGKRKEDADAEVDITADIFEYYGTKGPEMLAETRLADSEGDDWLQHRPIGVLLGVMPWNYPIYQIARFAAPNLVLGNTLLIKPASTTAASALLFAEVLDEAGLGEDVYQTALARTEDIEAIIRDPRVVGVSLTGSERAGAAVAKVAGEELKKVVLELGGSDPFVVLDETDVEEVAKLAVETRMENMGQACNAPKRFIVMEEAYEAFLAECRRLIAAYEPGDPADPATTLGPVSSEAAAEELERQVTRAVEQGAELLVGGHRLDRPGAWFEATLLAGVTPEMDAYREEIFGPVAVVYRATSDEEAIEIANDSPFGLGGAVFGQDPDRCEAVGERLEVGMVSLNIPGGTEAYLPFGGVKRSGNGRELGRLGITEFANQRLFRR